MVSSEFSAMSASRPIQMVPKNSKYTTNLVSIVMKLSQCVKDDSFGTVKYDDSYDADNNISDSDSDCSWYSTMYSARI